MLRLFGQFGIKSNFLADRQTAGPSAAAAGTDAGRVDVPLGSFAADELQGAGSVLQRPFHRGLDASGVGLGHEAMLDGHDGQSGVQTFFETTDSVLAAAIPAAAMDEEHKPGSCNRTVATKRIALQGRG